MLTLPTRRTKDGQDGERLILYVAEGKSLGGLGLNFLFLFASLRVSHVSGQCVVTCERP